MVPTEYDFWLFDLDGTLVDVDPDYPKELFKRVGATLGREFTESEVDALWYGLGGERDRHLEKWGYDADRFWQVFHQEENPTERAEATYLYEDASAIAEIDVPVGLVTHCQRYLAEPVLERLDIADWFDAVVCCDDDIGWKPDPAPVRMAIEDLGVADNGHRGVLAGDDPQDVGAAWNAGLDSIHVERFDPHRRGRCVLGDYRLTTLDGLHRPAAADGGRETDPQADR